MPYKQHYTETARELTDRFKEQFGELSAQQLWTLVRFAKMIRRSCRNNSAFNVAANLIFPYAQFRTVSKTKNGRTFPGLEIAVNNESISDSDEDDE